MSLTKKQAAKNAPIWTVSRAKRRLAGLIKEHGLKPARCRMFCRFPGHAPPYWFKVEPEVTLAKYLKSLEAAPANGRVQLGTGQHTYEILAYDIHTHLDGSPPSIVITRADNPESVKRNWGEPAKESGIYTIGRAIKRLNELIKEHKIVEQCPVYCFADGDKDGWLMKCEWLDKMLKELVELSADGGAKCEWLIRRKDGTEPVIDIECVPDADWIRQIQIVTDDFLFREDD